MEEKVSIQEENNKKYFDDNIFLLINKYKETNYESVLRKNNYCDININNKWTVGKIKNLKDDTATIINLDNEDNDIKVYLFQADKISYLRKYSKPNDRRTYSKRDDLQDLDTIKSYIETLIKFNFADIDPKKIKENYKNITPYDMVQNLRGKLYFWLDNVLNTNDNFQGIEICVNIFELIFKLLKNFFDYLRKNNDIVNKYKELIGTELEDIVLIDIKYSIISFEEDALIIYNKIMGQYPIYNDFYIKYGKEVKKIVTNKFTNDKTINKICKKNIYENIINDFRINDDQVIPTLPIAYFIDYFNSIGGYQSISNFIVSNPNFPFNMFYNYIIVFKKTHAFLEDSNNQLNNQLTSQVSQIRVYFQKRMMNLNENEIKKFPKEVIINILYNLSRILPFDETLKMNVFEELYLNYILACFQCKNLEKQIYAMNTFNSIIISIDHNSKKTTDKYLTCDSDKYVKNMKYNEFISALNKTKVLDYILGDSVHEEIMKRSFPIIILMYKNNFNLQDLDIETIYEKRKKIIDSLFQKLNIAEKNDEILTKTLKKLISRLSQFLLENDREYAFGLIKDYVTNREITKDNINLVKDFTINFLSLGEIGYEDLNKNNENDNFEEKKLYGTQLLWDYMQDNFYIQKPLKNNLMIIDFIEDCVNSLKDIFNYPHISDKDRNKILKKIVNNINKNESEVQSFQLLKNLLSKSHNNKYNQLIKNIHNEDKSNIFDLVVNNLNNYYVKIFSMEENKGKKFEELSELVFQGFFTHSTNIRIRIELMIQLLSIDLETNYENFFILWKNLIQEEYSKDILYKELLKNLKYISYNFKTMLFQLVLINEDLYKIDNLLSFKLFQKFLIAINIANGVFITLNDSDLRVYKTNINEIIGLNKLWEILTNTNNIEIQTEISNFLSDICLNVKDPSSDESITFWSNFISELIRYLNLSIENKKEEEKKENENNINEISSHNKSENPEIKNENLQKSNEIAIKGLIILIKKIYEKFGFSGNIINNVSGLFSDVNDPNERYYDYIFIYKNKNYKLKVGTNELLYSVRYKISNYFEIPVNTIQFQVSTYIDIGKVLKRKFDLCCDFQLFNSLIFGKQFDYTKISNITINIINNPIIDLPQNPKQILSSLGELFEILVNLLRYKKKIYTLDVWQLLKNELNKNEDLNIKIKEYININISKEQISELNYIFDFDNTSSYYKCYLLSHVVYALEKKDNKFLEEFMKSQVWEEKLLNFIKKYSIKNNEEIESKDINEKDVMLQTINYIIGIFKILYPLEKEILNNLIIEKLLEFISDIFYNTINGDIKGNLYYSQSKTIEIIFNFICTFRKIFIGFLEEILNNEKSKELFINVLVNGIIESKNHLVKEMFKMFMRRIYDDNLFQEENKQLETSFSKFLLFFLLSENTLNKLTEISKKNENYSYNIFFEICDNLIEKIYKLNIEFEYNNYVNKILLPQILSNEIKEELLSGCFLIIYSISKNYPITYDDIDGKKFDFVNYIFYDLLFSKCRKDPLNTKPLIIKQKTTFFNASNLLTLLIINDEIKRKEIINKLYEFQSLECWKSSQYLDWKLSFDNDKKEKFVGLKNLGCTCYMNSLFQILYLIPKFRESILNTEIKIEKKNVLYQLKVVFNNLKFLDSKFYSPIEFAKNFDNQELNVREQMDIDEFFNLLIDKLENNLQETKNMNLIKYFFQGKNKDNLEFQEGCTHNRENETSFYSIQLQIKNKKDLYQSLDSLIDGELMSGDNAIFCQSCNKKIPAIKHQSFKILPRTLIFVLKRFEFNYNTMTKTKINDYYEFPIEFDMTNYTFDYLHNKENYDRSKNNNMYKLKGVVVHSGNSEGGHYYSFIYDDDSKNWFEFNDISVRNFNIDNLKQEAFGGFENIINFNTKKEEKVVLNRNAYLLFYEKIDMSNCEQFDNVDICNEISNNIKEEVILNQINQNIFQYNVEKIIFSIEYNRFILQFLTNILSLSYNNNEELLLFLKYSSRTKNENLIEKDLIKLREKAIGSNLNNYINLGKIKLMNKNQKNEKNSQIIFDEKILMSFQFLILYFFNVLVRAKEKGFLGGTVDLIKFYLNEFNECSEFFIQEFSDIPTLMEYFINCPVFEMKKLFVGIIFCAMIKLYNTFNDKLNNDKNIKNINLNNNQNKISENNKSVSTNISDNNIEIENVEIEDKPYTERNQTSSLLKFLNSFGNNNNKNKNLPPIELKLSNHLQSNHIPKTLLNFINNIIYLIQRINDDQDSMFLYYILYRYSTISNYTKDHLIMKIPMLNYLLYHLFPKYSERNIPSDFTLNLPLEIIKSDHNILTPINNNEVGKIVSKNKSAIYRKENYIYMLLFNLLLRQKSFSKIDDDYQFKLDFILDLLFIGTKTKQDAICLSFLVNKICYNNSEKTKTFINAFMKIIENNDSIHLDNIMLIFKRFLIDIDDSLDNQNSRIKNALKQLFRVLFKYNKVYSHCDYLIRFTINIFLAYPDKMFNYINTFKDSFENMKDWIENNKISPLMYEIKGLQMYKKEQNSYNENSNIDVKTFEEKCRRNSNKNIEYIDYILNSKIKLLFFIRNQFYWGLSI